MAPIPITLLSGFLGSGKTTLLEHILTNPHGLKIAVIINDMSTLNIDAALIQNHKVTKKEEKLIQLQNGCICCTLRGDLLDELVTLAKSGQFQYIIIESTGISEPMQVAETFTTEFTEMLLDGQQNDTIDKEEQKVLQEIVDLGGLKNLTQLDTCVTVIDAHNFMLNFETTEFLVDRFGDNGQNEVERTITDLMVDQIEFADVIIINKISTIKKKKDQNKIMKIIKALNPVAKVLKTDYCKVDIKEIINTKLFEFEKASTSAGWLQSINEMTLREGFGTNGSKAKLAPKPETEEYGINNFVFKSRKPFHPERLYNTIKDKFVVIEQSQIADEDVPGEEDEEDELSLSEDDSEDEGGSETGEDEDEDDHDEAEEAEGGEKQTVENKKNSVFGPLIRSKGFFWLASRHIVRGEWSSAGPMLTLKGGIPWFDVTGPEYYPPAAKALIEKDMEGEFGDRRNELVFIGLNIDAKKMTEELNACLLTDEEFDEFKQLVKAEKNLFYVEKKLRKEFLDGFEDWLVFDDKDIEEVDQKIEVAVENHKNHSHVKPQVKA